MKIIHHALMYICTASLMLSACGSASLAPADNLLDAIKQRGYFIVSTDPNYKPQSFLNTTGTRPSDTKCPADTLTTAEMQGFDVDVTRAIGDTLGVESCFATPSRITITAGNWANNWNMSVGVGSTPTKSAGLDVLYFTTPYYYPPAVVAIRKDSSLTVIDELSGQTVCVGAGTTYEDWLKGVLDLAPEDVYTQVPASVTVITLNTDQACAQAIAAGHEEFVAYITSKTVLDSNIADGLPVQQLEDPVFIDTYAIAFDKNSSLDSSSLFSAVDDIVKNMHADGRLSELSKKWFKGMDLSIPSH